MPLHLGGGGGGCCWRWLLSSNLDSVENGGDGASRSSRRRLLASRRWRIWLGVRRRRRIIWVGRGGGGSVNSLRQHSDFAPVRVQSEHSRVPPRSQRAPSSSGALASRAADLSLYAQPSRVRAASRPPPTATLTAKKMLPPLPTTRAVGYLDCLAEKGKTRK